MEEADFVVVGAGSAGCVVASRLSEDRQSHVLLVEAGGSDRHPLIRMPLAWMQAAADSRFDWGYVSEPDVHLNDRRQNLPRGRLLGGSGSINGTMYIRGAAADYDAWRDSGLSGWGYADVLPYFRRAERNWRGAGAVHGDAGPQCVTPMRTHPDLYPACIETAAKLGYPQSDDFNGPQADGFGIPDCTIRGGRRHSTARAYLEPARSRSNLRVLTESLATRVLIEGGRAVGVEIERAGRRQRLRARREVILCGGAFNSPQLLMLSGVGPAQALRDLGIEVQVDLPGVGANLQDHPIALTVWAAARENTFESRLRVDRLFWSLLRWQLSGTGDAAQSPLTVQGFIRSSAREDRPDVQFQVSHVSYAARPWFPGWRQGAGHQISAGSVLLDPTSRGRVWLASADPRALAKVQLNFFETESDREKLRGQIRFMRRYFATDPVRRFIRAELAPGSGLDSDADIDTWLRSSVISAAHPVGTCAMGNGRQAVVDAQLKLRGVAGLRVADASVMPRIVRGNTNAPVTMIAEKASDMIRGRTSPAD